MNDTDYMTPHDVADELGVDHGTVLRWIRDGAPSGDRTIPLPAYRLGNRYRIKRADFDAFLEACKG